jgi:cation:H+ antiporter
MDITLSLTLFVVGFAILITGARFLVNGAASVATLLQMAPWVIGVAIVGIGTSIPELSISISSALQGNNVGLGAIIGSNTFNLLMILGLVALFSPIVFKRAWYKDLVFNIGAIAVATLALLLPLLGDPQFVGLTFEEGMLLTVLFLVWILFLFKRKAIADDGVDYQVLTGFSSFVMITAGFLGVFLGGKWVVDGAETLALLAGLSPAVIGLTVVAIGTSLPELTVALVAIFKKQDGLAVGGIIGSNIFDFLGILGITALIKPFPVFESIQIDIYATLISAVLLTFLLVGFGKRGVLSRKEGMLLILGYIAYLYFIL